MGWLCFLGRLGLGACLADDMGLGKTAQLLRDGRWPSRSSGPTLVVCPVSVLGNWQREAARFAPALRVMVHHGPAPVQRPRAALRRARGRSRPRAHDLLARCPRPASSWPRFVGPASCSTRPSRSRTPARRRPRPCARSTAGRRIALTGTPVENRLAELWSLMHVLNPGLLGTARSFRDRFAVPIERDGDPEATELPAAGHRPVHPPPAQDRQDDHRRPAGQDRDDRSLPADPRSRPRCTRPWSTTCCATPTRPRASSAEGWCSPG